MSNAGVLWLSVVFGSIYFFSLRFIISAVLCLFFFLLLYLYFKLFFHELWAFLSCDLIQFYGQKPLYMYTGKYIFLWIYVRCCLVCAGAWMPACKLVSKWVHVTISKLLWVVVVVIFLPETDWSQNGGRPSQGSSVQGACHRFSACPERWGWRIWFFSLCAWLCVCVCVCVLWVGGGGDVRVYVW